MILGFTLSEMGISVVYEYRRLYPDWHSIAQLCFLGEAEIVGRVTCKILMRLLKFQVIDNGHLDQVMLMHVVSFWVYL